MMRPALFYSVNVCRYYWRHAADWFVVRMCMSVIFGNSKLCTLKQTSTCYYDIRFSLKYTMWRYSNTCMPLDADAVTHPH